MPMPSKKSQSLNLFPDKLFFKIGEASRILEIESYVLRYWESEFSFLKPKRSESGQRIYTKEDVALLQTIKKLLYEEKYTIDGVRKKLQRNDARSDEMQDSEKVPLDKPSTTGYYSDNKVQDILNHVRNRLRDIVRSL